jgi:ankyrin repeat protein
MSILKLFIEKGADVLSDPRGYGTPLHGAAAVWPEAIPILLEAGANVNTACSNGRTPLMAAAFKNQLRSMELLLAAGANLEDKDNEGTTPLILAARAGKSESIEWLLGHGANILAEDNRCKTAEDWAIKRS